MPVVLVLLISQATALGLLVVIVIARGAGPPDTESLIWAVVAGLSETVGVAALSRWPVKSLDHSKPPASP